MFLTLHPMESISLNSFVSLEYLAMLLTSTLENTFLTQKLHKQGYWYHDLRGKNLSKFYRRYYDLISKFKVGLKSLLRQALSEPEFYGDLPVYKLKKELHALRGYFGPPMRPKIEIPFSPNSSYWFIRTMTQVYKSDISLTFTVAMVTKMAAKTG